MVKITTLQDGETGVKSFTEQSLPIPVKTRIAIYQGSSGAYEAEESDILYLLPSEEKGIEVNKITSEYGFSSDSATRASLTDMGTPEDILIHFRGQWPSGTSRSTKNARLESWRTFWEPKFSDYTNDMVLILQNILPSRDFSIRLHNPEFEAPPPEFPKEIGRGAHIFIVNNAAEETQMKDFLGIDPPGVDIDTFLAARTQSELDSWRDFWLNVWGGFNRSDMITFTNQMYDKYTKPPPVPDWFNKILEFLKIQNILGFIPEQIIISTIYKLVTGEDLTDEKFDALKLSVADFIFNLNTWNKLFTGKNLEGEPEEVTKFETVIASVDAALLLFPVGKLGTLASKLGLKFGFKSVFNLGVEAALKNATPAQIEAIIKSSDFKFVFEAMRNDPSAWYKLAPKFSKEAQALISKSLQKQHPLAASRLFEEAILLAERAKIPVTTRTLNFMRANIGKGIVGTIMTAFGIMGFDAWTNWPLIDNVGFLKFNEIQSIKSRFKDGTLTKEEALEEIDRVILLLEDIVRRVEVSTNWNPLMAVFGASFLITARENLALALRAKEEIERTEPPVEKGRLIINPIPTDAKVSVSGQIPTTGIFNQELDIGSYSITVSKFGFISRTITEEVFVGDVTEVTVTLEEEEVPPVRGTLNVDSNVVASEVFINGVRRGLTPLTVQLEPETYTILVTKFQHTSDEKTVTINSGETETFSAEIELIPPPPPEAKGILNVGANIPEADVRVEGIFKGRTPLSIVLSVGTYFVQVTKFQHTSDSQTLEIRENETTTFIANIQPPAPPPPFPPDDDVVVFPPPPFPPDPFDPDPFPPPPTGAVIDLPFLPEENTLVMNIETSGVKPFDSKLVSIGLFDPRLPDLGVLVLIDPSEKKMLSEFLRIFKDGNYKKIVGYNVNFDYRYLITKAMKFNLSTKEFADTGTIDMMEAMQKGKIGFVFSRNKTFRLTDWAKYFFNFPKQISDAQMLKQYALGNLDVVVDFTRNQVIRTFELWKLWNMITNSTISELGSGGFSSPLSSQPSSSSHEPGSNPHDLVQCKKCLAEMPNSDLIDGDKCPICKELIK